MVRGERRALESELERESAVMHRIVSQRADQHDAHLTSLAALALPDAPALEPLFLEVADAIRRFCARVVAIDLVPLDSGRDPAVTTRAPGGRPARTRTLRSLARALDAPTVVRSAAVPTGHYLLVKRVPSDPSVETRFVLVLEIDAARLLETDGDFWALGNTERSLTFADDAPPIVGDPAALEQVVFNLVRNGMDAVDGQAADRTIRVASAFAGSSVEITVSDTDPGIDPSMTHPLFEPFATAKPGGMGLGLTLCERIVERMDGEIEIGNAARGVLARLRFRKARAAVATTDAGG